MRSELVAMSDLQRILEELQYPYFIQIQSDGSYKLFLQVSETVDGFEISEMIDRSIQNRNRDREENEDLTDDVHPLAEIEFVTGEDLQFSPHFEEHFAKRTILPSAKREQLNSWVKLNCRSEREYPPVVTFYSYKGGVGRSSSLAIVARLLSRQGRRVAVVDFDLEAPGQGALLSGLDVSSRFGVIDYLAHKPYLKERLDSRRLIKDYLVELPRLSPQDGAICLMPAGGRRAETYLEKLTQINFDHFLRLPQHPFETLFEDIHQAVRPDIILLDARTGFADVAGTLLFTYSDLVSVHVYNDAQNKIGIESLVRQLTTLYQNPEDRIRMIWTHTAVPKWKPDEFHGDLQIFLREQLNRLDIGALNDESEYFMLGQLPYIQDLDGANYEDISDFVKNGANDAYKALTQQIWNLVNKRTASNADDRRPLSQNERREIINQLHFGNPFAEYEHYATYSDFCKNFLLFSGVRELLHPDTHLILGPKGSGKSTLFQAMRRYEKQMADALDWKFNPIMTCDILGNPVNSDDKHFVTYDDLQRLENWRNQSTTSDMMFWKRFWKLYLFMQLLQDRRLFQSDLAVPDWMRQVPYTSETHHEMIEWIVDRDCMDQVSGWLRDLDQTLSSKNTSLSCLYDHLDKIFENDIGLQRKAIEALLSFWDDLEYRQIIPKILLRSDIYERINIQNKSHWWSRSKQIVWGKHDLHRLILKRALESSPALRSYIENYGNYFLGQSHFVTRLGIEIPADPTYVDRMIEFIFGVRIGKSSKSGLMKNWFYNHLRDANDTVFPRDAIYMLTKAVKWMKSSLGIYDQEDRLISGEVLSHHAMLSDVSKARYDALVEEYPHLEPFFKDFKRCHFNLSRKSMQKVAETIHEVSGRDLSEINQFLNTMSEIGILKRFKNGNVTMPDLYLHGFNASRTGPWRIDPW